MKKLWRWNDNLGILIRRPGVYVRTYRWPLLVLAAGAAMDAATSIYVMELYGPEAEFHVCIRLLAEWLSVWPGVIVAKTALFVAAVFVASLWRRWCGALLTLCGVLYALAALSNAFGWL